MTPVVDVVVASVVVVVASVVVASVIVVGASVVVFVVIVDVGASVVGDGDGVIVAASPPFTPKSGRL